VPQVRPGSTRFDGIAFSPDGRRLLYRLRQADGCEGQTGSADGEIVVVPVAGGEPVAVGSLSAARESWSPDSSRIAFTRDWGDGSLSGIEVVDVSSRDAYSVGISYAGDVVWTKLGIYAYDAAEDTLVLVDPDDRSARPVAAGAPAPLAAHPSGRFVVSFTHPFLSVHSSDGTTLTRRRLAAPHALTPIERTLVVAPAP
jgi:hypothetical protein